MRKPDITIRTLPERLREVADRASDFDHPAGWLEADGMIPDLLREAAVRIDLLGEEIQNVRAHLNQLATVLHQGND